MDFFDGVIQYASHSQTPLRIPARPAWLFQTEWCIIQGCLTSAFFSVGKSYEHSVARPKPVFGSRRSGGRAAQRGGVSIGGRSRAADARACGAKGLLLFRGT